MDNSVHRLSKKDALLSPTTEIVWLHKVTCWYIAKAFCVCEAKAVKNGTYRYVRGKGCKYHLSQPLPLKNTKPLQYTNR